MRKNCSSDQQKLFKFKAEGQEFEKNLRSLEQFLVTKSNRVSQRFKTKIPKNNICY